MKIILWYSTKDGSNWSDWQDMESAGLHICAASNKDNNVELFLINKNNDLFSGKQ